ncbi:MAG: hypothetical protein C0508_06255 [Cyanobacteria bacterium PR.023]|jgi:hypothetical protein|nr:hypothetical protein [Cyanobacteria bacterium PR.023]
MLTLSCPSCGANVNFQSKVSVFAVCSFCKASLVRQGMDLEKIGQVAELQDDLTPIQIGTTGMFKGQKFEVVGRMKVGYEDGFWNEWFTYFADEKVGWLAEAQGFYAVCFPCFDMVPPIGKLHPGKAVDFGKYGIYEVDDVRKVSCLYSEGELPFNALQGRKSESIDLSGFEDEMATIEIAEKENRVFLGAYVDFDDLQFKNLRRIDGW